MDRTFNYKESINMILAVCGSYFTRKEIMDFFNSNFDQNKQFRQEEIKQIVRDITTGKIKTSTKIGEEESIR